MLCWCWEKTVEKKTITKPLLAESKSTGESKIAERKLTGFERDVLPSPKVESVAVAKVESVAVAKVESVPVKPLPLPKPEVSAPIPIPSAPKPVIQAVPEENFGTLVEKNDLPREKKNRSKSRR